MIGTKFDVEVITAGERRVVAFADGSLIHRRGEIGNCAYIVKKGRVEIRQKGHAVETIEVGEIFGEMGLIDEAPRIATAVALGAVEVVPIDRKMFAVLLRDDEDFALTVMRLLTRRLRATTEMFERCVDELPPKVSVARQGRALA